MSWLINGLLSIAGHVVTFMMTIIGDFVGLITKSLFTYVVLPILTHTVFSPFNLAHGTPVGDAAAHVWGFMGLASAGVALLMLVYAAFMQMTGSISGQHSWKEVGGGVLVWLVVLVAGWTFLNLLLHISDVATTAMASGLVLKNGQPGADLTFLFGGSTKTVMDLGSAGGAVFTALLWPLSGLLMAALALWAVGVWLMRQVDLVMYAGFLPIAAALSIGGNRTLFKTIWSEAMGAVFSQLAMATIFWIGFQFINPHAPPSTSLWVEIKEVGLMITTFTLAARAPQLLGRLTGHQSVGSGHILAGMAGGYLAGRGLAAAANITPAGQAVAMAMQGREAKSQAQVMSWAGREPLGQRIGKALGNTKTGQAVKSSVGSAKQAFGESKVGQAMAKATAPGTVGGNVARAGGHVARTVAKPVQSAASMMYQPMSTLGHAAAEGRAWSSPHGQPAAMNQAAEASMATATLGVEGAARFYGGVKNGEDLHSGHIEQLGEMMHANIQPLYQKADGSMEALSFQQGDELVKRGQAKRAVDAQGQNLYHVDYGQASWQGGYYKTMKNIPVNYNAPPRRFTMKNASGGPLKGHPGVTT